MQIPADFAPITRSNMAESLFLPIVTVDDNENVSVDFSGSFDHTYDAEMDALPDAQHHTDLLDRIIGPASDGPAAQLRRLADHIENLPSSRPMTSSSTQTLERFLATLPAGHPERPGVIRSLEILRTYGHRPPRNLPSRLPSQD